MSLDARLRQGMINVADNLEVETYAALVEVRALGRKRERRNIAFAALAGAAAATLLVLAGPRLADQLLSMEVPLPPARPDNLQNNEIDRNEERRVYDEADVRRANRVGRNREPVVTDGMSTEEAPRSTGVAEGPGISAGGVPSEGSQPDEEEPPPPPDPIQRTADAQYTAAHAGIARSGSASCDGDNQPCFKFAAEAGERFVSVSIDDDAGGPVFAWIQQDVDGDGSPDGEWAKFCDSTAAPIRIAAGAIVRVMLDTGTCPDGTGSAPTQGSITVTFSDRIR